MCRKSRKNDRDYGETEKESLKECEREKQQHTKSCKRQSERERQRMGVRERYLKIGDIRLVELQQ